MLGGPSITGLLVVVGERVKSKFGIPEVFSQV